MKNNYLIQRAILPAVLICLCTLCYAQNYQWANPMGGITTDISKSVVLDANGNSYIAGDFEATADFDPSTGTANLNSNGMSDIFLAKYDPMGNYVWAFSIGGSSVDRGDCIVLDSLGNIYITGNFRFTVDFDPSTGTALRTGTGGAGDVFIAKYDSNGNYLWVQTMGGTSDELGLDMTLDNSGNIYVSGQFSGTTDLDPSAGTANLTSVGGRDAFLAKYDPNGNYLWAIAIGGGGEDKGYGIALDDSGNPYISGHFQDTTEFDAAGSGSVRIGNGGNDIFVAKYDANGNFLWANAIGSANNDESKDLVVGSNGDVYITGYIWGTADFDPSGGTANLSPYGSYDTYIAKYDANGNYLWAYKLGGTFGEVGMAMAIDDNDDFYVTGYFGGTVDFDPSGGTASGISNGSFDIFFAKYDLNGDHLWSQSLGGIGFDYVQDIISDNNGSVFITGSFPDTVDFDPSPDTANLVSVGISDIFLAKYASCNLTANISNTMATCFGGNDGTATVSLSGGSGPYTYSWSPIGGTGATATGLMSGTYNVTVMDSDSCIVTESSTISEPALIDTTVGASICQGDSILLEGSYQFTSGVYTDTIPSTIGCDSVVTVNLTVNSNTTNTISPVVCDSYTVPSGDETYTVSGTYIDTLPTSTGCDSILTINLTIPFVDTSVTQDGDTLTANAPGATYQWLDCDSGYAPIPGETGQSFTPLACCPGGFSVVINEGGCVDTSACLDIDLTSIFENNFESEIQVYPNPNHGTVNIDLGGNYNQVMISVHNLAGQLVLEKEVVNSDFIIINIEGAPGHYLITIESELNRAVLNVVKEGAKF